VGFQGSDLARDGRARDAHLVRNGSEASSLGHSYECLHCRQSIHGLDAP
jgi:hypothetical protein